MSVDRAVCRTILVGLTGALVFTTGCAAWRSPPAEPLSGGYAPAATTSGGNLSSMPAGSTDNPEAKRPWMEDFYPQNIGHTVSTWVKGKPDPDQARQLFDEATVLYDQGSSARQQGDLATSRKRYLEASEKYSAAADRWPESALEEDARFRAGESYFFADSYPEANEAYEKLLKKYPSSKYLDVAEARRFAMANYWLDVAEHGSDSFFSINMFDHLRPWHDTKGNALRVLDKIPLDDPTGKLADDAMLAAGNAYFRLGQFDKADQYYTDLRRTFPNSEHQFLAHFLGMKSKLEAYQGPAYSGKPLEEAEKLVQQIRRQFPHELESYREDLNRSAAEVRYRLAEREWTMGQYYARRREYGAARLYYDTLVAQYPDTPFAQQAREREAETAGEPLVPEQRLSWLVDLFPESEDQKPLIATAPSSSSTKRR